MDESPPRLHPHAADPAVTAVEQALAAKGVTARTVWFDDSTATAAQAAEQLGVEVGAIANSLLFTFDGEPLLILASGGHRVDVRVIGKLLGGKVRTATPEFAHETTGQRVGGVSPIGHPSPIRTLVDVDLGTFETVWAAAGHAHAVFPTTFDELVAVTGGTPVTVVREATEPTIEPEPQAPAPRETT
jgi:prolyl-tRNA editing enzyme YbaK/EbsC (Cys-tRNA(Pro) deacylase)